MPRHAECARKKSGLHQVRTIEPPFSILVVSYSCCSGQNSKNTCSRSPKDDEDDGLLTVVHVLEFDWGRLQHAPHHCGTCKCIVVRGKSCLYAADCSSKETYLTSSFWPFVLADGFFVAGLRDQKQPRHKFQALDNWYKPLMAPAEQRPPQTLPRHQQQHAQAKERRDAGGETSRTENYR